ncbi:hypothetical protein BGZ83_000577 [Gryganskiella cystojenkinii]|nr:hypothetical protein BGZ83_000577 [Gryganskiella cystojenkinii]
MDMDPFEARLEFGALLSRLNATQHSVQKVSTFAITNRDLHEDLYNCITEELDKTSINARMNLLYVLDAISQQSQKVGFKGYIDLIQRNLSRLIETIAPAGPKGNVNVAGAKKILESWRTKRLYPESAIVKVERPLLARELGTHAPSTSEAGLSKDDILRRMDEDRERHKRIREDIWIRGPEEDPAAEFLQQWNEVPDLEGADYEEMVVENERYLPGYEWEAEYDTVPVPSLAKKRLSTHPIPAEAATLATLNTSHPESIPKEPFHS